MLIRFVLLWENGIFYYGNSWNGCSDQIFAPIVMNKMNRSKGNLLMCISEILIGILLLSNFISFTTGIIVMIGIVLIILSLLSMLDYFRASSNRRNRTDGVGQL